MIYDKSLTMERKVRGTGERLWDVSKLGGEDNQEKWYLMSYSKCL